jgi:hypothetical protein
MVFDGRIGTVKLPAALLLFLVLALVGCDRRGPNERALDDNIAKAREAMAKSDSNSEKMMGQAAIDMLEAMRPAARKMDEAGVNPNNNP